MEIHLAQENVSEVFCRDNSPTTDFLLTQVWWVWHEAETHCWDTHHHVTLMTARTTRYPDNTTDPIYQCAQNCSLLQAGMQMSIKNKALFFGEFPPKPSKITPNLFVKLRTQFSLRFW